MLFTSQSNVSKTIAALEKELGKKIFERRRHKMKKMVAGNYLYACNRGDRIFCRMLQIP